jgi:hypothetical protein
MNRVKHQPCVLFGLAVLFALSVTAANAGSPEKPGLAGGTSEEMNEPPDLSFDFPGDSQGNQPPPYGWGVGGTPPGKAFESGFVPAGHADGGVSGGINVPQPATMVLVGTGLLGLSILDRKKLKK